MGFLSSFLGGGGLGLVGDLVGGFFGHQSAQDANRANIKLARENRDWQAQMDNTAVQRRADDIERAGGNRALAFTNGQSAGTPAVASPTVEPTFRPEWTKGGGAQALMLKAQLANLNAQTASTAEQARKQKMDNDITESLFIGKRDLAAIKQVEEADQVRLKTNIMKNQEASSAAERKRLEQTVDAMIQMARQQAEAGKIDLDALRNIASINGVEASKATGIIKLLMDFIRLNRN